MIILEVVITVYAINALQDGMKSEAFNGLNNVCQSVAKKIIYLRKTPDFSNNFKKKNENTKFPHIYGLVCPSPTIVYLYVVS